MNSNFGHDAQIPQFNVMNNIQALNNNNEVFTNEQLNIQGLDQLTHQQTINNLHANNQLDYSSMNMNQIEMQNLENIKRPTPMMKK